MQLTLHCQGADMASMEWVHNFESITKYQYCKSGKPFVPFKKWSMDRWTINRSLCCGVLHIASALISDPNQVKKGQKKGGSVSPPSPRWRLAALRVLRLTCVGGGGAFGLLAAFSGAEACLGLGTSPSPCPTILFNAQPLAGLQLIFKRSDTWSDSRSWTALFSGPLVRKWLWQIPQNMTPLPWVLYLGGGIFEGGGSW